MEENILLSNYVIEHYWKKGIYTIDLGKTRFNESTAHFVQDLYNITKKCTIKKKDKNVYLYDKKQEMCYALRIFQNGHLYALKQYNEVPILEIDGLRMHLIKEWKTPFHYAKAIIKALHIRKGDINILDCCAGLGYVSIELSKYGNVISVEKSREVISLARINPFSKDFFNNKRITIIEGDIFHFIDDLGDFDYIIHDPPRFSHSPELYSQAFYDKLKRHMKKGAKLFHYTGYFGRNRRVNIKDIVAKRLYNAGIKPSHYDNKLKGWIAINI
ncbi:MAG: methyltransferase domain-containing protein [Candidatus Anstonellales archaeon]